MLGGRTIAVVVPCFNEAHIVERVIETMPAFVDRIIAVDDASTDGTASVLQECKDRSGSKLEVVNHERNEGVGGAIVSGYRRALETGFEVIAVMGGDGQMAPEDLASVCGPVVDGRADYAKGNRLFTGEAWHNMPRYRYIGSLFLSLFTKIASGYWHVADSQSGYTAIDGKVLRQIDSASLYRHYGFPNDLLIKLNVVDASVSDVPIKAVYGVGEKSGIRVWRMAPRLLVLLVLGFYWRLLQKYVIRNFHPIVFFYMAGLTLLPAGLAFGMALAIFRLLEGPVADTSALLAAVLLVSGLQFLLFAMWLDYSENARLRS